MKKINSLTILVASFVFILAGCTQIEKTCIIKGKLVGFKSESILLLKAGEDMRFEGLEIPVQNGTFEYELKFKHPQGYKLFLGEVKKRAGGRPMALFIESGEINITLYPEEEFDKNIVKGGKLNAEYQSFEKELKTKFYNRAKPLSDNIDILYKKGNYYSDTMQVIFDKMKQAKSHEEKLPLYRIQTELQKAGLDYSDEAKIINDKQKKIWKEAMEWQQNYINQNLSIVSYYLLFQDITYRKDKIDIAKANESYQKLSKKFKGHPYNEALGYLLGSIDKIKVGGKYIDFTLPDMDGQLVKLSDIVDGKVALIDLWASWCGPCIAHSRTIVPVYEEFKDNGFTVVGVAAEFKNTEQLKKALKREKFPWLNLVEMDKQNRIWEKYGIPNSGGKTFLVDRDGSILVIHPSAKEVREILKEKLQ